MFVTAKVTVIDCVVFRGAANRTVPEYEPGVRDVGSTVIVTAFGVVAMAGTCSHDALEESVYWIAAPVLVGVTIDVSGTFPPI